MRNLALMWVLAACLMGCDGKPPVSTFTDARDGKTYKIVKIGSQTWFAENLNYAAKGSKCYGEGDTVVLGDGQYYTPKKTLSPDEVQTNCAKYGRLYTWETALPACPAGTHLPSDEEWATLVNYAGGDSTAGKKLKSSTGWERYKKYTGTDEYGFSAFPGGIHGSDSYFKYAGYCGGWWSATEYTEYDDMHAWGCNMCYYNVKVYSRDFKKTLLFSVRCVMDDEKERRK
jgi:uncharacterized protein (TIGR02145 family)